MACGFTRVRTRSPRACRPSRLEPGRSDSRSAAGVPRVAATGSCQAAGEAKMEIYGFSHEILSPQDATSGGIPIDTADRDPGVDRRFPRRRDRRRGTGRRHAPGRRRRDGAALRRRRRPRRGRRRRRLQRSLPTHDCVEPDRPARDGPGNARQLRPAFRRRGGRLRRTRRSAASRTTRSGSTSVRPTDGDGDGLLDRYEALHRLPRRERRERRHRRRPEDERGRNSSPAPIRATRTPMAAVRTTARSWRAAPTPTTRATTCCPPPATSRW